MKDLGLSYFYANEADNFQFIRIPKLLFSDVRFKKISAEAKLLYGVLLDAMGLSRKNGWIDKQNRVFIKYSISSIMETFCISRKTAIKCMQEIDTKDGIGLIERVSQGKGKADLIYVKNFTSQRAESAKKSGVKITPVGGGEITPVSGGEINSQVVENLHPNNTNINNTNNIYINSYQSLISLDHDSHIFDAVESELKEKINYDNLIIRNPFSKLKIDEIISNLADIFIGQTKTLKISGINYPSAYVKKRLLQITDSHIEYLLNALEETTKKINNTKQYILTCLFNNISCMNIHEMSVVNELIARE